MTFLYLDIADQFMRGIQNGAYQVGERLPGVRATSISAGVSHATSVAAYRHLEAEGFIESRPRSGFYVKQRPGHSLAEPKEKRISPKPRAVTVQQRVLRMAQQMNDPDLVNFGANVPAPAFLPTHDIARTMAKVSKQNNVRNLTYEVPPGLPELRRQIARRMFDFGSSFHPDEILVTNGCQEALYLSLKAVTHPGDIVVVESPAYYGVLQILDALKLKAIEVPTHPRDGISLTALTATLESWPVKACVVMPNFSNPLGTLMPTAQRQALIGLINKYPNVYLIEDDIYGDFFFKGSRPNSLQSLDRIGNVIYCASFSKSMAPGLRIGWVANAALHERLAYEKFTTNCATPTSNQIVIADMLKSGRYDRHLKSMRPALQQAMNKLIDRVTQHFPETARITRPSGGTVLWVELDRQTNAMALSDQALAEGISIAPGPLFSPSGRYNHCVRLTGALQWNEQAERGIERLGQLVSVAQHTSTLDRG